jgi:hypothetical protein
VPLIFGGRGVSLELTTESTYMSRIINRLSKRQVVELAAMKKPGLYPDGDGLYLQITDRGTASFLLMYKHH